jgi:hypothetical protein
VFVGEEDIGAPEKFAKEAAAVEKLAIEAVAVCEKFAKEEVAVAGGAVGIFTTGCGGALALLGV